MCAGLLGAAEFNSLCQVSNESKNKARVLLAYCASSDGLEQIPLAAAAAPF